MFCKYCGTEISEEDKVCSSCGKNLINEEPVAQEVEAEAVPPKKKGWKIALAVTGAVVALTVLAGVLLLALGVDFLPRPNNVLKKDSYTVSDEKAGKKADDVIAVINGKELTNAQLMFYYRSQVIDLAEYYGSYLTNLGFDYTKPLSEQPCYFEDYKDYSWQQYLLEYAIKAWENDQRLILLAEQDGFVLSEESEAILAGFPEQLTAQAAEEGYESLDAMLEDIIGPGCTQDTYMQIARMAYISGEYYASQAEAFTPSQEEIEAHFTENAASFEKSGITKESGLYSAVRHILVIPEGGTEDETTNEVVYTDAEWADCLAKAEAILKEWKDGEATEESFGELATTYTEDGGSSSTGGLYEGIYYGSGMVEEFESWAIDSSRQVGDTGIVKTQLGYHIMYFVQGEENWIRSGRIDLQSERLIEMMDDAETKWPVTVRYGKIALAELNFA